MTEQTHKSSCQRTCWIFAAGVGVIILILSLVLWHLGMLKSILFGVVVFVVLGFLISWLFCRGEPDTIASDKGNKSGDVSPVPSVNDAPEPVSKPADTSKQAIAEPQQAIIKPSKSLAGQAELADRKGSWTYSAEKETAPAVQKIDIVAAEGTQPATLSAPRDGGADDLKRIKGIGPKLEKLCNEMGVYHFDQIAGWNAEEVAWMDANLKGFKGRVTRDEWVAQASLLASGGETEFSKRVDKGGVY